MNVGRVAGYVIGSMIAVLTLGTIFRDRFVTYQSVASVLVFAAILGVLTAYVKSLVTLVTLPLTCLTFGLFLVVINVGMFALAAWLTPGLEVTSWGAAIGALLASVANGIVFSIVDEE